ncbi:hypothetical protein GCM10023322_83400 [Rugosimonospora acidiphila]|uniref:Uncharacterized protein n=1 Tax=Rugosimonospora acidiphila TaxID=556531 RepID=A0ABP9SVM5_9ACTN
MFGSSMDPAETETVSAVLDCVYTGAPLRQATVTPSAWAAMSTPSRAQRLEPDP